MKIYFYLLLTFFMLGIGDKVINVSNIGQLGEIKSVKLSNDDIWDIKFHPDGHLMAILLIKNDTLVFLDTTTFSVPLQTVDLSRATAVTFNLDGSLLALGDRNGQVSVYDTNTYNQEQFFPSTGCITNVLKFNSNELLAVTFANPMFEGRCQDILQVRNINTGELVFTQPYGDGVYGNGIAFNKEQNKLFFSTTDASTEVRDAEIKIWDVGSQTPLETEYNPQSFSRDLIFDFQTGQLIYVEDEYISIINPFREADSLSIAVGFEGNNENITNIALHPTEPILAVGYFKKTLRPDGGPSSTNEGSIRFYNIETGDELAVLDVPDGAITALAFSPDGTLLASGGADGTVRLWGIPAGE